MRFLIINTDYEEFTRQLYAAHPGMESLPHADQLRIRMESMFGSAGFYAHALRSLGHEVYSIIANSQPLQRAWAREHSVDSGIERWRLRWRRGVVPWIWRGLPPDWYYQILSAQIRHYRPDVLYNHPLVEIRPDFLKEMRPFYRLLVGQHAAFPLPEDPDYGCYDLALSSFPPTVDFFRKRGIRAELSRLAFDARVLAAVSPRPRVHDLTFIGNLFDIHRSRRALIETLCREFPTMKVWTPGAQNLPADSPIRPHCAGEVWGLAMYEILAASKITVNHHGDIPPFANNYRLYEATGMGALLATDAKDNLEEMFKPGREVIAYRDAVECADLIRSYLTHDDEREAIARAGQERTLREHTFTRRMEELCGWIQEML